MLALTLTTTGGEVEEARRAGTALIIHITPDICQTLTPTRVLGEGEGRNTEGGKKEGGKRRKEWR